MGQIAPLFQNIFVFHFPHCRLSKIVRTTLLSSMANLYTTTKKTPFGQSIPFLDNSSSDYNRAIMDHTVHLSKCLVHQAFTVIDTFHKCSVYHVYYYFLVLTDTITFSFFVIILHQQPMCIFHVNVGIVILSLRVS